MMRESTTSETVEWKTTTYSCEVEGCDFTTQSKSEAERHFGDQHATSGSDFIGNEWLLKFDSKENFDAYCKAHGIQDRFAHWDEPGWYRSYTTEEPCGRGCCWNHEGHLDPAVWIGFDWQKKIKKYQDRLKELEEFLDTGYLLEED